MSNNTIRVGVDVGGTFTDVVLWDGNKFTQTKVATTENQADGVVAGIEKICNLTGSEPSHIDSFVHGMTVPVNALLERTGAKTALITTAGFRDILKIGRQDRPNLYDPTASRVAPLVPRDRRFALSERVGPDGLKETVSAEEMQQITQEITQKQIDSVAVCFLFSYQDATNEQKVKNYLKNTLSIPVKISSEVLPEIREYERTAATVIDAYLTPVMNSYLETLAQQCRERGIPEPHIMKSDGGVARLESAQSRPITTIMSGPAAGVVGARSTAKSESDSIATKSFISLDMGGTSTDVSYLDRGEITRTTDATVGEQPVAISVVDIETVGAGGGSVAWVDSGGALRVGPDSAGAVPGPACYDRGGTDATVTDAALLKGFLADNATLGNEVQLNRSKAYSALQTVAEEADLSDPHTAAEGIFEVATQRMGRAIRSVTVERGFDPRECGLVAYGGAGPMVATQLASQLDINTVIIPPLGGVLSAYGLVSANERYTSSQTYQASLESASDTEIESLYAQLEDSVSDEFDEKQISSLSRTAELRYEGQSHEISVAVETPFDSRKMIAKFHTAYADQYGYQMDDTVEIVTLRVAAVQDRDIPPASVGVAESTQPVDYRDVLFASSGGKRETPIYRRSSVSVNDYIDGPAVIEESEHTIIVPPRWTADMMNNGTIQIRSST